VCGRELFRDERLGLCADCRLPFNTGPKCPRCGIAVSGEETYCERCKSYGRTFDGARSALIYEDGAVSLLHGFKFGGARFLAKYFCRMMTDVFKNDYKDLPPFAAAVPVPLSADRLKERGYNQAELLARGVAEELKLPVLPDILIKVKDLPPQAKKSREERQQEIEGAFVPNAAGYKLNKSRLLLIDDVLTTGATTEECAKVLKKAGADYVYCLTLAAAKQKVKLV